MCEVHDLPATVSEVFGGQTTPYIDVPIIIHAIVRFTVTDREFVFICSYVFNYL